MEREVLVQHMQDIRAEVSRMQKRVDVLNDLLEDYDRLFELDRDEEATVKDNSQESKGTISFRQGVRDVLRDNVGFEMTDVQMWEAMQKRGVISTAKDPVSFVRLHASRDSAIIREIDRHTFEWAAPVFYAAEPLKLLIPGDVEPVLLSHAGMPIGISATAPTEQEKGLSTIRFLIGGFDALTNAPYNQLSRWHQEELNFGLIPDVGLGAIRPCWLRECTLNVSQQQWYVQIYVPAPPDVVRHWFVE